MIVLPPSRERVSLKAVLLLLQSPEACDIVNLAFVLQLCCLKSSSSSSILRLESEESYSSDDSLSEHPNKLYSC